ncbi:hypothetical protein PTKIN_Ptkin02bG0134800 [Pterospermum kingtungense]
MSAEQKEQPPNPNSNDNLNSEQKQEEQEQEQPPRHSSTARTPFTNLSQERAYMMLKMNNDGSDYGSWEAASHLHDDEDNDDFGDPHDHYATGGDDDDGDEDDEADYDVHAQAENGEEDNNPSAELDPAAFSSDEAYARALQDAEERDMAARLFSLAGINDTGIATLEDHRVLELVISLYFKSESFGDMHFQDTWEEVDPDELSYEELLALGEVVGTESRGLSSYSIASLPSVTYKAGSSQIGNNDSCVICRVDYEDGDSLTMLSCKHSYHLECVYNWLKINKVCPVCSAKVSTSGES